MVNNFINYMYAKQLGALEQEISELRVVSGYSVEQLIYLFAKGYTLQPPKEPMTMCELAKEMEKEI